MTPQTAHTSCPLREPPASLQALALTPRHTWWFSLSASETPSGSWLWLTAQLTAGVGQRAILSADRY